MIPLVRPEFPNLRAVERNLAPAWVNKHFSNFGKVFDGCVYKLSALLNGNALPVTSGTTAIQVALTVLGMKGKRVGLPDYTHSGTLLAVVQAGAIPVLFGVENDSWTLVPRRSAREKVDCFIAVSPFGYFLDIAAWENFSRNMKCPVVYDLAGAFGHFPETENPRCYSFHSTKNFGVGEGGCVVFKEQSDWEKARRVSNFGTLLNRDIENDQGLNAKIDELKCACILAMLETEMLSKVWKRIQNKQALLRFYEGEIPEAYVPIGPKKPSLCVLGNLPAHKLEELGAKEGIICRRYYPLLTRMPGLEKIEVENHSSGEMNCCIALPSDASWEEAYRVVEFVKRTIKELGWTQR